jgi:hypothetical protein
MPVQRFHWVDDNGSGMSGTVINDAELQRIFTAVDNALGTEVVAAKRGQTTPNTADNFLISPSILGLSFYDTVTMELEFYMNPGTVPTIQLYLHTPAGLVVGENLAAVGQPFVAPGLKLVRMRFRCHPAADTPIGELWGGTHTLPPADSTVFYSFAAGAQWSINWGILLQASPTEVPIYYAVTIRRTRNATAVGTTVADAGGLSIADEDFERARHTPAPPPSLPTP